MKGLEALSSSAASRQATGTGKQDSAYSKYRSLPRRSVACSGLGAGPYWCWGVQALVPKPAQARPQSPFSWACSTPHCDCPDKPASVGSIFLFPDGFVCWLNLGPPMAVWEPGPSARLILGGSGERQPTTVQRTPLVPTHPPRDGCKTFKGVWHSD